MNLNLSIKQRKVLCERGRELSGEHLSLGETLTYLRNKFGLAMEHYVMLLANTEGIPANFVLKMEHERHDLALNLEKMESRRKFLEELLENHNHGFFGWGYARVTYGGIVGPSFDVSLAEELRRTTE